MIEPRIKVLGVYKVELTDELLKEALTLKYGGANQKYLDGLTEKQIRSAEEHVREELSSVVTLEVLVEGPDEQFDVGDFSQPDSDQVAYDEAFLSADGTSVLSRSKSPESDILRVAFFLHFFDPQTPLLTSYGEISVPPIQEMPDRLKTLVPYEPVD